MNLNTWNFEETSQLEAEKSCSQESLKSLTKRKLKHLVNNQYSVAPKSKH